MIDPGAFRTEVALLRPVKTHDGTGGFTTELQEEKRFLAAVLDAGGREREAAEQLGTRIDKVMLCHAEAGVVRGDWIEADGTRARVVSVRPRGASHGAGAPYLYVLATELETG